MKKALSKNDSMIYPYKMNYPDKEKSKVGYKMYILGVRVDFSMSMDVCVKRIMSVIEKDRDNQSTHLVCTTNPEFIVSAQNDRDFADIINQSYMSVPDGVGVVLAKNFLQKTKHDKSPILIFLKGVSVGISNFLYKKAYKETIPGADLFERIVEEANKNGNSLFLLGGRIPGVPSVSAKVADILCRKYKDLNIIGYSSDFNFDEADDDKTVLYIQSCMAKANVKKLDILAVAYGHSKQEKWIHRNAHKIPATVSIGLGGTFDFMGGFIRRAPKFVRSFGLEWTYRLFFDARRPHNVRRILTAFPIMPLKVLFDVLKHDKK